MQTTNYFTLRDGERDVIVHAETGLRVNVFSLENVGFQPTAGELHIFGDDHGEWLAFETEDFIVEPVDIFKGAVVWYARYLDYPEMEISPQAPRPPSKLKKT